MSSITLLAALLSACGAAEESGRSAQVPASRPDDVPALHHAGLNSVDPEEAIDWYLALWPSAERSEFAGRPAIASEMYLVFNEVNEPPTGAFDPELGRPRAQSAFWHIGAFANTTGMDETLAGIGVEHLPLFTGPSDTDGVWRSGLTPYSGIVSGPDAANPPAAAPRPGGFSYVLAPDGVLFELTGGPNTNASLSHVHFFHEQPQCTANWYVETLGMSLPPTRNEDGSTTERPLYEPCEGTRGEAGWPSLEQAGTIRQPRGTVVHANGSMSWYPRQCTTDRCGAEQPLVPSRGQAIDHVAFSVTDLDAWHRWITRSGAVVLEELHTFTEGRAFMFEGPDRLAVELVELTGPVVP